MKTRIVLDDEKISLCAVLDLSCQLQLNFSLLILHFEYESVFSKLRIYHYFASADRFSNSSLA